MTISLVLNTCAKGPKAAETKGSGGQTHERRAFALRNFILPAAIADPTFSEVIVVGEWEPGNGYIYIEVPSERFSCVDALAQRQAGFERSTGGWIVFQHDDHYVGETWVSELYGGLISSLGVPDVIVPARYTRLRDVNGERLFNGEPQSNVDLFTLGYISGHCAIYRREVLEHCAWGAVPKVFDWDVKHTAQIRDAGFKIEWTDALRCYDVESGSKPWG